jgi:hypothetical protein
MCVIAGVVIVGDAVRSPAALVQRLAVHQFEHQELCAVGFVKAVDGTNVRMVEGDEDLGFSAETRQAFRIVGEGVGKDLQGDVASELRVTRAIDFAHPAGAEGGLDFVGTEA